MSSNPPFTQTGTGTSSNPFVAPAINTKKPFEPPEFSVIRDLLSRKFIEMEMNPFGVAGANTGNGMPLPPSWSPFGVGGAAQGTPGAMWNPMTGAYGGQSTPPALGGAPGAALSGATPQESPQPTHDGEGRPWYDDGSHGPQAPGVQKGYDGGSTWTGGPAPESPNMNGVPTMGGAANPTPAPGPSWTTGAGMNSGPTMGGAANRTAAPWGPTWTGGPAQESPNMTGGPTNNPLLASLGQQNMENSGQGPKAWNSTAANNPWAGMNESQFRSSMGNNVGGGGIFGLQRLLGHNLTAGAAGGPTNMPGMAYTGAQHEWGGNPWIGSNATRAGWNPQQTGAWTVNGLLNQNPSWGGYLSGSGNPALAADGYDASGAGGNQTPPQPNSTPTPPGNVSPPTGGGSPTGGDGSNPWSTAGGFPWTQAYQGQFTAPLNQTEQGAMNQYQNFINGLGGNGAPAGPGLAPTDFANLHTSGPGANSNQTMDQIQNAAQGWQNYENQEALRRIGSSAAAGGGALSGANLQAQGDYLNNANNLFNQTMGTMRLQNSQFGQQLQNALLQSQIGAQGTMGAAGEYAGAQQYGAGLGYQENQQNLQNQALQNLFSMGQVGQNTEQNQYNSAYNDWVRQTNNMQNMFTYPDQFGLSQLAYGQYGQNSQPNAYGTSDAAQWQALLSQILGGGSGGSTSLDQIINGYNQGSGGGGTTTTQPASTTGGDSESHYDGFTMGHDGVLYDGATNPSLSSLTQGRDYWLNRLNQSESASNAAMNAGQPSSGQQTASGILSLLNMLLGGGGARGGSMGQSGQSASNPTMAAGASGSGQLGLLGLLAKGVGALLKPADKPKPSAGAQGAATPPSVAGAGGTGTSTGMDPTTGLPAGASMTTDPSGLLQLGVIDPNNYNMVGQPNVIDPNQSNWNQELTSYLVDPNSNWGTQDNSGFFVDSSGGDSGGGDLVDSGNG